MIRIPVYRPDCPEIGKRNVLECLDSTWISSKGRYLAGFERRFAAASASARGGGLQRNGGPASGPGRLASVPVTK